MAASILGTINMEEHPANIQHAGHSKGYTEMNSSRIFEEDKGLLIPSVNSYFSLFVL